MRYYSKLASSQLEIPANDTRDIVKHVLSCLDKIWQTVNRYQKAGSCLGNFAIRACHSLICMMCWGQSQRVRR
ncbi:DinB/UmuC family translesion DNA polymerase [Hafnia alvei]|uniref:DinB/UmuC family translesion DNA polymerase n=1 Tax=Hafnia alvei TaxID=569 RepID=UPI00384C4A82